MASELLTDWWNQHATKLEELIRTSNDPKDDYFHWGQLVWQELEMWEKLGTRVTDEELTFMCNRRGFTEPQREHLIAGLTYLGLYGPPIPRTTLLLDFEDT